MIFNSYTFIVFFAIVLFLHNLPLTWKTRKKILLLASYIFYAAWNLPCILLLWLTTWVNFYVGKSLYTQTHVAKRKLLFVAGVAGNLGLLCYFKYGAFLLDNFVHVVNVLGVCYQPAPASIILPAGISFYTLTTLCYTIDMYKRHGKPVESLLDFSLFVAFFPHLFAGPIVRPEQLVPQFESPRTATRQQLMEGLFLLSLGLFMKVVLADAMLAPSADKVFSSGTPLPTLDAWMGVLAFAGQIFFDFAGYATCAIGVALSLGFILPQNFMFPYAATGFSDFWKRWHITLSTWLRDYLYIPLGGNRHGKARAYINVMITMLLGGLWHGASWTFVAWGGLHGLYLLAEKFVIDKTQHGKVESTGLGAFAYALFTFLLITITWVFFKAETFEGAGKILTSMFTPIEGGIPLLATLDMIIVAIIMVCTIAAHGLMRNRSTLALAYNLPWWITGTGWSFMLILLIWSQKSGRSFIYFQF